MVALRSDQRETKDWTLVAQKSDHRALIDLIHLIDSSFSSLFQMTKIRRHLKAIFYVYFLWINFVLALTRYIKLFIFKLKSIKVWIEYFKQITIDYYTYSRTVW